MLRKNKLALAVSAVVGASAGIAGNAYAQDERLIEEVIVTGSAIKRVDLDNALPITVISQEDIARTGVTNTTDLIQKIPSIQNPFTASDSVGGGGGGIRTANLRGIGSQYTLSLLNGRRMAPADSGSTIDLSNIPLAAVERVEVLKDGASALYGSDAIAGVVNFITKDEVDETRISVRGDRPSEDGGESWNFDIVTGFGSFDEDGYSVVASYSHESQDQLASVDRDFAETGFISFNHNGERLFFQNSSPNAIPGNATVRGENFNDIIKIVNPYALENGSCHQNSTPTGDKCGFDYTSTIEILPEHERDSIFLNGKFRLTDNLTAYANVLASQYEMTTRIAPYPTGSVPIAMDSAPVVNRVLPHLTAEELARAQQVTVEWRGLPAGNRTTEWAIDSYNFTAGLEGSAGELNYRAGITHAITDTEQNFPTGWLLLDEFVSIVGAGAFDPFSPVEDFTDADNEALAPGIYHGPWDETESTMTAVDATASLPVFDMAGGQAILAGGVDYRTTYYERTLAPANENGILLFLAPDTPYELERDQWGAFTELFVPVLDSLELTATLRYDDISGVDDKLGGADLDEGDDDITYKISGLWTVTPEVAFRASYGTGFKAPSMREIGEPLSDFGVTSGTFDCPFPAGDPLAQFCFPTSSQYAVFRQGSPGLSFETSTQYSYGVVLTPWDSFDMTIDYWNIEQEDLVERLTESQILNNAEQFRDLFTTRTNQATGQEELAIIQQAVNAGTRDNSGIDYALNQNFDLGWGSLDLGVNGTYMIESDSSLTGSSLGRFGNDDEVVFRNLANFTATLYHGNFTHNVNLRYRSGYDDQQQQVEVVQEGVPLGEGETRVVQLEIPSYTTIDYQLRYVMLNDSLALTGGINNLGDREPPLSLRVSGSGHQVGWDPRYSDPYGRTYYLQAEYKF